MLAKQKIIPEKYLSDIGEKVRELYADRDNENTYERFGIEKYAISKLGVERAGFLSMGRTIPSQDQQLAVRHKFMKIMCMFYDFQKSLLNFASDHQTIPPRGWTWNDNPSLPLSEDIEFIKTIPVTEHHLTWHQVINPP